MEITNLSWKEHLSNRFNNPLLPRSIRGLIVGKSGCGKTTLLLNLLLKPGWLDYDTLFVFGKSLFQPEYKILRTALVVYIWGFWHSHFTPFFPIFPSSDHFSKHLKNLKHRYIIQLLHMI